MGSSDLQLCDLLDFLNNKPWMKAQFVVHSCYCLNREA
jgi:hypothetical protein